MGTEEKIAMDGVWHKNHPKPGALVPIPGREMNDLEKG
jgi:hypothetical protein